MPRVTKLLETALYVDDLARSLDFYKRIFGFELLETPAGGGGADAAEARLCPLNLPGRQVLLLFRKGSCTETAVLPGGTIPPHDASGRSHLAFAVSDDDLSSWRAFLDAQGIPVEGETEWPKGGTSLYFRDPDGHLLELATPGIWPTY
jgi:catechol 2,3-dioxygenase-like lactoylglutathione lyase family enzyme